MIRARVSSDISETPPKSRRKTLVRIAKFVIALLVSGGLLVAGNSAVEQWQNHVDSLKQQITRLDQQISEQSDPQQRTNLTSKREALALSVPSMANLRWERIVLASLLYGAGIFVPGLVLHAALRSLGESPRWRTSVAAQLLGHAGKYVPGKAVVIVLRAGALSIDEVSPVRATVSVFMETLLMMAVGAAVAGVVIVGLPVPVWMKWSSVCVAFAASIPTVPPILRRVAARVSHTESSHLENDASPSNATSISSLQFFVTGWGWSLVSWIIIGASFTMLVSAIPTVADSPPSSGRLFAVSTAAIALAMVVGFASLLPGGAGVRELVLTTVLATAIGSAHALLAALAARLMFIAVESVCAAVSWLWIRRQRNTSIQSGETETHLS